ncbi:MAG: hypothetical protein ACRDDC_09785, partial [Tannerellaceae bacterium]
VMLRWKLIKDKIMKNLYILDDHHLSSGNGVGTFLNDLTVCSKQWGADVQITMIMLRTNTEEFCIHKKGDS